jgi:hypothetical protein
MERGKTRILKVSRHHTGVQRQHAAAAELSGQTTPQRYQPALQIVSVGVKVQRPSLQAVAQHFPGETETGANHVHVQNSASYPGRHQLPVDARHMH